MATQGVGSMTPIEVSMGVSEIVQQEVYDLAMNRFRAARRDIEREPCLNPLRTTAWTTAEEAWRGGGGVRDIGNGVFWRPGG